MKRFLYKIVVSFLVLLIVGNLIAVFSLYSLGKSSFYKPQFLKNAIKDKDFDYVILGSSTGLTTLDSKQIDNAMGSNGLNISLDDSSLNSHHLMMDYFLSLGKQTKKLILCITPWDIEAEKNEINDNDYRFLSEIRNEKVHDYYQALDNSTMGVLVNSRFCPLLGVSYYNKEVFFTSLYATVSPGKRNQFDEKGNFTYPEARNNLKPTKQKVIYPKFRNPYFFRIVELCRKNNIELIVYQSPIHATRVEYPEGQKFRVINHSAILPEKLFCDPIHVNSNGRKFCTEKFIEDLQKVK